jgi:hypothetical protein
MPKCWLSSNRHMDEGSLREASSSASTSGSTTTPTASSEATTAAASRTGFELSAPRVVISTSFFSNKNVYQDDNAKAVLVALLYLTRGCVIPAHDKHTH